MTYIYHKTALLHITLLLLLTTLCLAGGCSQQGGPSLPVDTIDESLPAPLLSAVKGLYGSDPDNVLIAIRKLGDMGPDATDAVPYLASMLEDPRLATAWTHGFGRKASLSKEAGAALGSIGESGINALADALNGTSQVKGMQDDLKRESIAGGFSRAISVWGASPFKTFHGSDRVVHIIRTAEVCLNLEETPGRFDQYDPRNSLKYYKHFSNVSTREGLAVYIRILGLTGDERALDLLTSIITSSTHTNKQTGPFEKRAIISHYLIKPVPLSEMNPATAEILLIEFTATGDIDRVNTLLSQGLTPDVKTPTGHPVIELAWKKKHPDVFDTLVKAGASVDMRLSKNDTLLIRSARSGEHEFVQALLNNGADPSLTNNAKETALTASLTELLSFWDGSPSDTKAKPYFTTIELLKSNGSPTVPEPILDEMNKKNRTFLNL